MPDLLPVVGDVMKLFSYGFGAGALVGVISLFVAWAVAVAFGFVERITH